jgi:hypothetical protein
LKPTAWARHALVASSAVGAAAFTGCAQQPKPMYLWEGFAQQQYQALLREKPDATEQIIALEAQAEKARATGAALPPGFRAHLGMLKLSAGDAAQARALWLAEKQAFPESSPYIDRLLQRLQAGPAKPDKLAENPA